VEVHHHGEVARRIRLDAADERPHQRDLRLREAAPIAVEIHAAHAVAPVAALHAVRVQQRHDHHAMRRTETACGRRIGEELGDEMLEGCRAAHLGRVLSARDDKGARARLPRIGSDHQDVAALA